MAIVIPNTATRQLTQYNKSDILGNLESSFNLDLTSNEGAIRVTRMKGALVGEQTIGLPVGFTSWENELYAVASDVYVGGTTGANTWTEETSSGNPSLDEETTDIKTFNNAVYVTESDRDASLTLGGTLNIHKFDGSWTVAATKASVPRGASLLEPYADNLYITAGNTSVWSLSTADVLSDTGTATLDLGLDEGWVITMLKAGTDRLWIGLTNIETNRGLVYDWDGQTENSPSNVFTVPEGVLCGVIKDNRPYIMTSLGRLMVFNGGSFQEVARLPLDKNVLKNTNEMLNDRWIHPNGMAVVEDNILININGTLGTQSKSFYKVPSGIWEYSVNTGLYHKYSFSVSPTSGTTFDDYGQFAASTNDLGGGLYFHRTRDPNGSTFNGQVIAGARLREFPGAFDDVWGIFTDDTIDTTPKWGYFVTSKIMATNISNTWEKLYTVYKNLLADSDKIVIKYKTREDIPSIASLTWVDTSSFTTTTDISAYSVGDEVQIVSGTGSGKSAHIVSIVEVASVVTVTLDDTFTGADGIGTAYFEKWVKLGTITNANKDQWKAFTIATQNTSPFIKLKVSMGFTGNNEVYKFKVIENKLINE